MNRPRCVFHVNLPGETGREAPFFTFLPILGASEYKLVNAGRILPSILSRYVDVIAVSREKEVAISAACHRILLDLLRT